MIRTGGVSGAYLMGLSALAAKSSPSRVILTSVLASNSWLTMSIAGTRKRWKSLLIGCSKLNEYMSTCTASPGADLAAIAYVLMRRQ